MGKVIGMITTCNSNEHRYLRGHQVRIIAVIKGGAAPDLDPDADLAIATTDEELERLGGLDAHDRVEVTPWIASEGRFSFVTSDPKATDLAAFELLAARK